MEPANSASPVKTASPIRSDTPPGLWPGVWRTSNSSEPALKRWPSARLMTLSIGAGSIGNSRRRGLPSTRTPRSASWTATGTGPSCRSRSGSPAMWSTSVWVRRIACTFALRPRINSTISSGSKLASITTASRVSSSSTRYELVPNLASAVDVTLTLRLSPSRRFPRDRVHVFDPLELLHQARELSEGIDLYGRRHDRRLVVVHMHLESRHVDPVLGHDGGDVAQQALPVPGLDLDGDRVDVRGLGVPIDAHDPPFVLGVDCVDAVRTVHSHAAAARRVADDRVPRHRLAAGRDLGQDPLLPVHQHARRGLHVRDERDGAQVAANAVRADRHAHHHRVRREVPVADGSQEVVHRREPMHARDLLELRVGQVGEAHPMHAVEFLVEKVAALGNVLIPAMALEPLTDALLGRRALDEVEPVATRSVRPLRRQDLDDLSVF